jgi:hypothetical protein
VFKRIFKHNKPQGFVLRLVPWVNGVKWRKSNSLERPKPKDRKVRFDGAAMAGPPTQNPKGRRLIPV